MLFSPDRDVPSPSPSPQPPRVTQPHPAISQSPSPSLQDQQDQQSIAALQAQQDAFRAMLRQAAPEMAQNPDANEVEDPTLKMLNSLLGAMPTDPNAPPQAPGSAGGFPGQDAAGLGGLGPAAIASALGLPPFLANMIGGALQTQEEDQKSVRVWKSLHLLFAFSVAFYLVFIIASSVSIFGSLPPKPATMQNPFIIFITGELLLCGSRVLIGGQNGVRSVMKLFKDVVRDGSLVIFALGLGSWYTREWQTIGSS